MKPLGKKPHTVRAFRRVAAAVLTAALFACALWGKGALRTVFAAEEGYWYLEEFSIEEIHEQGITGKGIKIADIDTLINLNLPWLSDADVVLRDKAVTTFYGDIPPESDDFEKAYHATDMVGLLQGNGQGASMGHAQVGIAPGATIYHYAAVHSEDDSVTGGDLYAEAMQLALEDNVDIILIPAGGLSYYDEQYPYFLEALKKGIPVLVAHANERHRIDQDVNPEVYQDGQGGELLFEELPTASWLDEICYWPGLVTVQALDEQFRVQVLSRTEDAGTDISAPGEGIWMQMEDWGYFEPLGGGCSAATTSAAGFLALAMEQWPNATGNQILQLMARTPEWQSSDAAKDPGFDILNLEISPFYGWGAIDIQYMLQTDPTVYPDVNPVLYKDMASIVKNAEVRGATDVLKTPELVEVAGVLDEQLEKERIDRPQFLKKILGNERGASSDSGEGDSAGTGDSAGRSDTEEDNTGEGSTEKDNAETGKTDQSGEDKTNVPSQGNTASQTGKTDAASGKTDAAPGKTDAPQQKGPDETGARASGLAPLIGFLSGVGLCITLALLTGRARAKKKPKPRKTKLTEEEIE